MLTLTEEQQTAADSIIEQFNSPEPKSAVLMGAAGTGKTFLTNELSNKLNPQLSAMTHKAAAVLSHFTDGSVQTLAKILKQKKFDNLETGETKFKSAGTVKLDSKYKTLFIDETSMMNKENYEQVKNLIMPICNVLFIGDRFQLPPVNESYSTALINDLPKFELTKPMRYNAGSGIDRTALSIRTAMEQNLPRAVGMGEILSSCNDVQYVGAIDALPMMIEDFKNAKEVDDVRMISFTNARVEHFNKEVKQALTGDSEHLKVGDLVMANATLSRREYVEWYDKNDNLRGEWQDVILIQNNDSFIIADLKYVVEEGLICYRIDLDNGQQVLVPVDRSELEGKLLRLKNSALSQPKGSPSRRSHFAEMFFLRDRFADLRLNYAQTVHKSQGSTYKTCYFDLHRLDSLSHLGKQLLYTGVTRSAEKLILFK